MPVYVNDIKEDSEGQESLRKKLLDGKKVTLKFKNNADLEDFIKECESLGFLIGASIGAFIGGGIGAFIAGPLGFQIGSTIGGIMGGIIGLSVGKWLARFIYRILGPDVSLKIKKLWSWLGLRKHRVQISIVLN